MFFYVQFYLFFSHFLNDVETLDVGIVYKLQIYTLKLIAVVSCF